MYQSTCHQWSQVVRNQVSWCSYCATVVLAFNSSLIVVRVLEPVTAFVPSANDDWLEGIPSATNQNGSYHSCAAVVLRIVWFVCGVTPAGHYRPSDPVYPALYSRCNVRTRQTARWIAVDPRQTHVPPSAAAGPVPWGSGQEVALNQDWFYLSSTQGGHAALQSSPNKQHPLSPYTLDRACVWRVHVVCKVSKGQDSAAGTWMLELL
jgi:hypothetical protein